MALKELRSNPVARAALALVCLVLVSVAFWAVVLTGSKWDDLWTGGDYYNSHTAQEDTWEELEWIRTLLRLRQKEEWEGSLSYLEQEQLEKLEENLSAENTNFRYQVHDQSGTLLDSNLGGALLEDATGFQETNSFILSSGGELQGKDYSYYDSEGECHVLMAWTGEGYETFYPQEWENRWNEYGYYSDGYSFYDYNSALDQRLRTRELAVEYGVARPMAVDDHYAESQRQYQNLQRFLPYIAALALVSSLLALAALAAFCSTAGRREDGSLAAGWQERIPYDVYLLADAVLASALLAAGDQVTYAFSQNGARPAVLVGLGVFTFLGAALALALAHTTAVRVKGRRLLRSTLLWRGCAALGRWARRVGEHWSVTRRVVVLFLLYLVGTALTAWTLVLIPVFQGFVLWCICRWTRQWRAIRTATGEIVGGNPDHKIDTRGMYRDLREHAEQLNDLGAAISSAVDERLRSERMKAELITNVSHDLKTPLTSIINYVDLLKKTGIQDPKALECIEVLERKSQRLKKLTEDLVEASKASTGSLTVNRERLGMVQLVRQALAEYDDRFEGAGLTVVPQLPEEEHYIQADGRHVWRVLDNLLSNCNKYALPGTRIYLDVYAWDGSVVLTVKNISSQALNIPADQLMERFVRGDESRTTEGSGLGLSIARSLTELQGGAFRIDIDGDLFKAVVSFPEDLTPPPVPVLPEIQGGEDLPPEDMEGNRAG